jgi:hypothetical protein
MKRSVLVPVIVALVGAACSSNSSPTEPSTTPTASSVQTFSGLLDVQGSSFYSFTVTAAEAASITLASLTATTLNGPASTAVVRLGLGVPSATDCSVTSTVDTAAGLTAQLKATINPDTYCVTISDIGNLTAPMNFNVRIGQNVTSSPSTTPPVTETFASFLAIGGASAHSLSITQGGTVSLTLTSVTPSSTIGVGIGVPNGSTSLCSLSASLSVAAGPAPQITVPIDPGDYCAEVYDPGGGALSGPGAGFSLTIQHP